MNANNDMVGESIICGKAGIGKIIEVVTLRDGGDEFFRVSFPKDKCINFFSIKNSTYRVLSSERFIKKAIKEFNTNFEKLEYSTQQEKINLQKEMLKEDNIMKLARALSILNNEKEPHAQIKKAFHVSLNSFIDETVFVLNVARPEVYSLLNLQKPRVKQLEAYL